MRLLDIILQFVSKFRSSKETSNIPVVIFTPTTPTAPTIVPVPSPTAVNLVGLKESKDISAAHPYLQQSWPKIKDKFETQYPGYTLKIAFVWRSVPFQAELYQIGRRGISGEKIVTNCDGITHPSNHNKTPACAIDIDIYKDGKVLWNDEEYAKLTPIVQELGLVHGLTWNTLKDPQHVELSKDMMSS